MRKNKSSPSGLSWFHQQPTVFVFVTCQQNDSTERSAFLGKIQHQASLIIPSLCYPRPPHQGRSPNSMFIETRNDRWGVLLNMCPCILFLRRDFCKPEASLHSTHGAAWQPWQGSAFIEDFLCFRQNNQILESRWGPPLPQFSWSWSIYIANQQINRNSCGRHLILIILLLIHDFVFVGFFVFCFHWYARDPGLKQCWEIYWRLLFYDTT